MLGSRYRLAALVSLLAVAAACSTTTKQAVKPEPADSGAPDGELACDPDEDIDKDGMSNGLEGCESGRDTDGDEVPDWEDFDSDNDGIPDAIEAGDKGGAGGWPRDSDGDGAPDYIDTDSDGDGLADKDEDANGDGVLGCCIKTCHEALTQEQTADCIFTKAGDLLPGGGEVQSSQDGCARGQLCEDGACKPAIGFGCSMGETDPRKPDSFGDGKLDRQRGTLVCRDGHKPIQQQRSKDGDWTIAIGDDARYAPIVLPSPGAKEAAAAIDHPSVEVAGFVVSLDATRDNIEAELPDILKAAQGVSGATATIRATGTRGKSHDRYDALKGTIIDLTLAASSNASTLRNKLVAALLGRPVATLGGLPDIHQAPPRTEMVLRLLIVRRFEFKKAPDGGLVRDDDGYPIDSGDKDKWRLFLMGAVVARESEDGGGANAVADLTNGTALAAVFDHPHQGCESHLLAAGDALVPLGRVPISASLSVILDGKPLARGEHGFTYDSVNNALVLRTLAPSGREVLVSHMRWDRCMCIHD